MLTDAEDAATNHVSRLLLGPVCCACDDEAVRGCSILSSFIVTSYDDFTFFLSIFRERGEEWIECTINKRWNTDANSFFSSVCTLIRARAHSYHGQSAGNVANRQRFFLSRGLASPHVEWLSDTPANIQSPMPCMPPSRLSPPFPLSSFFPTHLSQLGVTNGGHRCC